MACRISRFVWRYLKGKVLTVAALKHSIKEETVTVWVETTCTVMGRMHSKSTTVYTDGWKSTW